MPWEAEPVDINHINVAGAQGVAFLENVRAFIGQSRRDARDDFVVRDGTPINATLGRGFVGEIFNQWIDDRRAAAGVVSVPTRAGLLPVTAHLKEPVRHWTLRAFGALFSNGTQILANARAHVDAGNILHGKRTHGHAELHQRSIDLLHPRPLLEQQVCLAHVVSDHAIGHKSKTVAHQHANFVELSGEFHARGDGFFRSLAPAHDFD